MSRWVQKKWSEVRDTTEAACRWWYKFTDSTEDNNFLIAETDGEKLRFDHDALTKVFIQPELEGKKFAIISIAGKMRTGKSFLMNYLLRYLHRKGWENPDWMGDKDCVVEEDGFTFKGGRKCCTTGIRIFGKIFELPISENEKMMIVMMDTQGLFDNNTPEAVNKTLLTLTTLMSSTQIFNSKENVDTLTMEYLKTCVEYALQTTKALETNKEDGYMKLQNLMFLVRDFVEDDEKDSSVDEIENYGLKIGNEYLRETLNSEKGGEKLKKVRSRIKESFDNVECFAMPDPGENAKKKNFLGRNKDLSEDFLKYVKVFVEHIMSPQNLLAKRSSTGMPITPREMRNMIAACDSVLAEKMVDVTDIIKKNQIGHFSALREEAVKHYDTLMKAEINENGKIDELEKKHKECKEEAIQKLTEAKITDAEEFKNNCIENFHVTCNDHFENTKKDFNNRLEEKKLREQRTDTAIEKYESMMMRSLSEPVTDQKLEKLHEKHMYKILEAYAKSTDVEALQGRVNEIYSRLEQENKAARIDAENKMIERQREEERKQEDRKANLIKELSNRSANMWELFLTKYRDESDMKKKKEKILRLEKDANSSKSEKLEEEELLNLLKKEYKKAKRKNDQNWISAKAEADCAVKRGIIHLRKNFDEIMVDQYIGIEETKRQFEDIKKMAKYKCKSKTLQEYAKAEFHKECDIAMVEILEKNERNRLLLPVMLRTLWRRLMELFFSRSSKPVFKDEVNYLDLPYDYSAMIVALR